jgi:hypothetical protein
MFSPVKLVKKVPVPDPDVVLNVEAPGLVPQTKPLEVTVAPPSEVIFPPLVAVVPVIAVTAVVTKTGGEGGAT